MGNGAEKAGGGNVMNSFRKELWFNTDKRVEFINITPQVRQCLKESGVKEGLVLVNSMHIIASAVLNRFSRNIKITNMTNDI